MEIIGFKMKEQRGFEIFKNMAGNITIKQFDPQENKEIILILTKYEAINLQGMINKMIDIAEDTIEQIFEADFQELEDQK
jgi:hypothetical protein